MLCSVARRIALRSDALPFSVCSKLRRFGCRRCSLLVSVARLFEEVRVEGTRQQVGHLQRLSFAAQVGERHGYVAAELPDDLATRTARRRQTFCIGGNRELLDFACSLRYPLP